MTKKLMSVVLAALMVLTMFSAMFTASALPYSKDFSDKEEMLASLSAYAEAFPSVEDYTSSDLGTAREGTHLVEKDVVMPSVSDESYIPVLFNFAESTFGSGVDYTFSAYTKDGNDNALRFLVYYHLNEEKVLENITPDANGVDASEAYTGKMDGRDYLAYAQYDDNGDFIRTVYNVAVDDKLVIIYSAEKYTTEFAEKISFENTGISLPVYENGYILPELEEGYNRYFFLMPKDWYNQRTAGAGIYWWEGTDAQVSPPGFMAHRTDAEDVYYYDVPEDVTSLRWNNNVYLNLEESEDSNLRALSKNTVTIEVSDECDGKIYVIDPALTEQSPDGWYELYKGEWLYYYGDGSYGFDDDPVTFDMLPVVEEGFNRYFFLAPEDWFNEHTDTISIYWWEGSGACDTYPGYEAHKADAKNIYYYDVPKDVSIIIWNNSLDGYAIHDTAHPLYGFAKKTCNIASEYYAVGETSLYPNGTYDFNGMIYVTDPSKDDPNMLEYPGAQGDWFYYYGDGRYGTEKQYTPLEDLPELVNGYQRLYFKLPEDWINVYTNVAGIYWWDGSDAPVQWPGYKALEADAEGIYYYDVPEDVLAIIWNNYIDCGTDTESDKYKNTKHTKDIGTEYYEAGESEAYPKGLESFDGMIYIIDPDSNGFSGFQQNVYEGEWHYYYGEGEYGTEAPELTLDTLPAVKEGCNRYFFYMPDYWYNEFAYTAGIYWWDGTDACTQWPGYKLHKADAPNIYYYDVPKDVEVIIWNNYLDGGADSSAEIYTLALQTKNLSTTGYEIGDSDAYPDGLETFDGMIFVIDPNLITTSVMQGKITAEGEWYYYYGDGRYGLFGIDEEYRSYRVGDTDDDFRITVKDATCIQKHLAGLDTKFNPYAADANEDERINIKDATAIQKNVAGIDFFDSDIGDIRAVMI